MAALLLALLLGVAGCGGGAGDGSREAEEPPVESEPAEVACGRPFSLPPPGRLRVAGRFPELARAGERTLRGAVEVTAREALRGVAAGAADVFLVQDGRVVTTPLPQDAVGVRWEPAAGETRSMGATGSLVSCEPGGGPLPPGRYELYARVVVTPDDGAPERAFGGPWPLRLR